MTEPPIRTLQVVESCSAGVGRHAIDLSLGLQGRGHPVTLVYSRSRTDARFERGLERLRHLGGETVEIPMAREIGRGDLVSLRALRRLMRERGPFDVVHGHSGKAGLLVRLAAARRVPLVYTPHAYITMATGLSARKRRLYGMVERALGRKGLTINVSEDERRHALQLGLQAARLTVVYNGIEAPPPPRRAELRARHGVGEETAFGFVGRLDAQKNPLLLVRAFARVREALPEARLVMVGDGPLRAAVEAEAGPGVLLLGSVDGLEHMPMFDAFVVSSDYEGFPYVLIEAAMRGLPIVSTRVGGVGEIVTEGENGRLVPTGDAAALAAAMVEVGGDDALRARMAGAMQGRTDRFGVDAMVEATLAAYAMAKAAG